MDQAPPEAQPRGRGIARRLGALPFLVWLSFAGLAGAIVGLGGFTLSYAQGLSYLTNDPKACANCHVMWEYYDAWNRGSHHAVAVCNDCHVPHDNLAAKYAIKALNGFRHSYAFTTGQIPEPIRIIPMDRQITLQACLSCHTDMVSEISHADSAQPTDCLTCHADAGHAQ